MNFSWKPKTAVPEAKSLIWHWVMCSWLYFLTVDWTHLEVICLPLPKWIYWNVFNWCRLTNSTYRIQKSSSDSIYPHLPHFQCILVCRMYIGLLIIELRIHLARHANTINKSGPQVINNNAQLLKFDGYSPHMPSRWTWVTIHLKTGAWRVAGWWCPGPTH